MNGIMRYAAGPALLLLTACSGGYDSPKGGPAAGTVLASDKKIQVSGGTPQSAATGADFATVLGAKVYTQDTVSDGDGYGGTHVVNTPLAGVTVTFTLVPGAGGAGGAFPGGATTASAMTGADGVATAPTLTANATAGVFTVTATAPGAAAAATFTLTNL